MERHDSPCPKEDHVTNDADEGLVTEAEPRVDESTSPWTEVVSHTVSPAASRKLYRLGFSVWVTGVLAVMVFLPGSIEQTLLGVTMLSLAVWPALQWAKNVREWFPVFEIFMLTGVTFYALPYLSEPAPTGGSAGDILQITAIVVITFQIAAISVFSLTRVQPSRRKDWTRPMLSENSVQLAWTGLVTNTVYIGINNYTTIIPYELGAPLRAVFFGAGTIAVFILARMWGQGAITRPARFGAIIVVVLQCVMLAAQLYLINVISMLALAMIGYTTTSRRIPIFAMVLSLPVLAILHSGKSEMRRIYWHEQLKPTPTFVQLPGFFGEWIELGLNPHGEDAPEGGDSVTLMERASLFQVIAKTVAVVPEQRPYLMGETYRDVLAQFVPRYFWPDKPSALDSNRRLSIYFGLVSEYSVQSVSIAFGMVAESYANFGILGAGLVGAVFGWVFKRVCVAAESAALFSPLGIFVILLTAWSLQVEMVAATWISSLFQATMVTVALPMIAMRLLGRR